MYHYLFLLLFLINIFQTKSFLKKMHKAASQRDFGAELVFSYKFGSTQTFSGIDEVLS
jgi:hypothetical protein